MTKTSERRLNPATKVAIGRGFKSLNKRAMTADDLTNMQIGEARLYIAEARQLDRQQKSTPVAVSKPKSKKGLWIAIVAGLVIFGVANANNDTPAATNPSQETKIVAPAASKSTEPTEKVQASPVAPVAVPQPTPPITPVKPTPAPVATPMPPPIAPPASASCDPNYIGGCVPNVSYDLDCKDIGFSVTVVGTDRHRFDGDGDGAGCESY